eukprot:TRINITY_DN30684_c0_g1_i1.p1 TRINITY_DN30684_c0_g1~~TRINITY_DN30684_c0_g1_i1.p1  ORF type:complete len:784 (+),score=211.10 TRINITY_DN30684_c0_g1_i1:58-2409(+)
MRGLQRTRPLLFAAPTAPLRVAAVPQSEWNPAKQPDSRQIEDPSVIGIALRRKWMAKRWLVGDRIDGENAASPYTMRPLAVLYESKLRLQPNFATAAPYYLEAKERGVPITTTMMNLLLATAQRDRTISESADRTEDVWLLYLDMTESGAKPDINTLDLMRNELHRLCLEYCRVVNEQVAVTPQAHLTASLQQVLVGDVSDEDKELKGFDAFLNMLTENSSVRAVFEKTKRAIDERSSRDHADIAQRVEELAAMVLVHVKDWQDRLPKATPEDIVAGSQARNWDTGLPLLRSGHAPDWEAEIVMRPECVRLREIIATLRTHLVEAINALCVENVHRLGRAINDQKLAVVEGQLMLERTVHRFRRSLQTIRDIDRYATAGTQDNKMRLRIEILAGLRLPPTYRGVPNFEVGCYVRDDGALLPEHRAEVTPTAAKIALSYYQPTSIFPEYPSASVLSVPTFSRNVAQIATFHTDDPDKNNTGIISRTFRERADNSFGSTREALREARRRDPAVQAVFCAAVDRIIEQGSAVTDAGRRSILKIAKHAFENAFLWPNSHLNTLLLTAAAYSDNDEFALQIAALVQAHVYQFDKLHMDATSSVGSWQQNEHLFVVGHPVLRYGDSGVGPEYFGLWLRTKPWDRKTSKLAMHNVLDVFRQSLTSVTKRWEEVEALKRKYGDTTPVVMQATARWEERMRNLVSPATFDAMLQIIADEAESSRVDPVAVDRHVNEWEKLRTEHKQERTALQYQLLLAMTRSHERFRQRREVLLRELRGRGREYWWLWFEEA